MCYKTGQFYLLTTRTLLPGLTYGFHFIRVCKPDSHKTLYEGVASFEKTGDLPSFSICTWNNRFHECSTYRDLNQVPLSCLGLVNQGIQGVLADGRVVMSFTTPSGCPLAALASLYSSLALPMIFLAYFISSLSTLASARTPTRCAI
jgi:hypothetical protein